MKVCIYGAGAMGTVLGAYLAFNHENVDLISRNVNHINGLKLNGAHISGTVDFTVSVNALLPNEMTSKYDIIFLMTKQLENKKVVQGLLPFLEKDGIICTMQNGLPEFSVSEVISEERTFGCAVSWGATLVGNGEAMLTSVPNKETLTFSLGSFKKRDEEKFLEVQRLLNIMGTVIVEENFIGARWAKLLVNSAFSGLSVVLNATFGEVSQNKRSRMIALLVIKEGIEVAKKAEIIIEPIQGKDIVKLLDYHSPIKKWISQLLIPIAMKKHKLIRSSMLQDISLGKKCEIEAINGVVCEYGDKYHIETPLNDLIVSIVKNIEANKNTSGWKNIDLFKSFF